MAHFAKLGLNSKVLEIQVLNNEDILDSNNVESEDLGVALLNTLTGYPFWVQTSYNGNFRGPYASVGSRYDEDEDAFIPPKPFSSWILNNETFLWESPTAMPTDNNYMWDEEIQEWTVLAEMPLV